MAKAPRFDIGINEPADPGKYDGSYEDNRRDYIEARKRGISTEDYENSASDRVADNAGQHRLDAAKFDKDDPDKQGSKEYKPGTPAFSNSPARTSGFGHSPANRSGHLRLSGAAGAHQIGKKK